MARTKLYIGTGAVAILGGAITVASVGSCDTECTLEARPSIVVNIGYEEGSTIRPLTADRVWYERVPEPAEADGIDGVAPSAVPQEAICTNDDCSQWTAAFEEEGAFRVFASVCGETVEGRATVSMDAEGCHVVTEHLMLSPDNPIDCEERPVKPAEEDKPACSLEARTSVYATILNEGSTTPAAANEVTYLSPAHTAPQVAQCANEDCTMWAIGYETAGEFTITASACGDTGSTSVEVGMTDDGCHVVTEYVTIEVDADRCKDDVDMHPEACDGILYPSVVLYVAEDGGDVLMPSHADRVRWSIGEGKPHDAYCVDEPTCAHWIAAYGQTGDIDIEVEKCGMTFDERVNVPLSEDGCRPVTQYRHVMVDDAPVCEFAPPDGAKPPPPPPPPSSNPM